MIRLRTVMLCLCLPAAASAGMSSSAIVAPMEIEVSMDASVTQASVTRSTRDTEVANFSDRALGDVLVVCSGGSHWQCRVDSSRFGELVVAEAALTRAGFELGFVFDPRDPDPVGFISIEPQPTP